MKFSTITAVLAAALCVAGCRYDKANKDTDTVDDGKTPEAQDITAADDAQSGSIGSASEGKFEDLYTRCTDVSFEPVYFGFDSTVLPQGELAKADAVVDYLAENQGRVVVVEGHCDERGSNEYNLALGENRSTIIRNYMVQGGISADRIQTRSYGEEKPAAEGHDESAWSVNRRGEFGIYQK